MKKFALAAGLILLICLAAGQVWAHKLNLYAYQEGSRIKGEAYFKGGIKVQKGIVKVLTKDGRMRAQTVTAKDGSFSLPIPKQPPPYTITLESEGGHKASYELAQDQLEQTKDQAQKAPAISDPAHKPVETAGAVSPGQTGGNAMVARALDLQELEAMVSRLLDQKLAPIKAQLAQQNAKDPVTLHDVVSGLGWILGLVGIAAWFLSRKAKPAAPPARRQP